MSRHPLGIITVVVVTLIVLIRGVLLRLPSTPRLGSTYLERLPLKVLLLCLLLLCMLYGLLLLGGGTPFLTVDIILHHRRPRGPEVDHPLVKVRHKLGKFGKKNDATKQ